MIGCFVVGIDGLLFVGPVCGCCFVVLLVGYCHGFFGRDRPVRARPQGGDGAENSRARPWRRRLRTRRRRAKIELIGRALDFFVCLTGQFVVEKQMARYTHTSHTDLTYYVMFLHVYS